MDNSLTRDLLIPSPKKCISKIESILPETIKKRTDVCRRWLIEAIKALNKPTATVEDFVDQSNSLNRVNE